MESPLVAIISHLNLVDVTVLAVAGILMGYCVLANRVNALMFMLVLGASLVGTTVPIVGDVASLVRWVSVLLLFLSGILFNRLKIPLGMLLFWGYVFLGFVCLFRAISIGWQFQRGLLLFVTAAAIPIAFSSRSYKAYRSVLVSIAIVAAVFAILNSISLPSQLGDATRSTGYSKTAPALTVVLGGLLPFSFWGLWNVRSKAAKAALGVGFVAGTVALVFSGQRAGTVAGIVGLVPLALTMVNRRKSFGWALALAIALLLLGFLVVQESNAERMSFLLGRYSPYADLSGRDRIWQTALSAIAENPLLGRGTGAAEWIVSSSFHNAYLEVWYNAGFPGLVLFITAQAYFFYRILSLNRTLTDPEAKSILALALGYMLGFVVLCIFESIGAGASNLNLVLYIFLGFLVSGDVLLARASAPVETRPLDSKPEAEIVPGYHLG